MKKTATTIALIILALAISLPLTLTTPAAQAQTTNYTIQTVSQNVRILYSGHVTILDTIQLTGQTPDNFLIGFPYKYASSVLTATAYDSNNKILPVTLGVQLQDKSGFYGTSISLPSGTTQTFTIAFTFSNALVAPAISGVGFTLDFPAYPSFTTTAAQINATLTLPEDAIDAVISKPDGAVNGTIYSTTNLAAFTYAPASVSFNAASDSIQLVNIPTLAREINIDPAGAITCTDTYQITSSSTTNINYFLINLPADASNIDARDEFGRILTTTIEQETTQTQLVNVTFVLPMTTGESNQISMDYSLPHASPQQSGTLSLTFDLLPYFNYYVNSATITITPPEGARIQTPQLSTIEPSVDLNRNVFQESLTIPREGVSFIDSIIPTQENLQVTYDYSPLWIAFRPTSWMWALAVVGCVIAALWTRPRGKAPSRMVAPRMAAGLSPEHIREFIDAYEERSRITGEIRSLEARAKRGRMPRRRYKVQRRTLELRLNTLGQNIRDLKELLRGAGGSYGDLVKQLDAAEVELNEVELSLSTADARHETGEFPIDVYRKQLAELERRKQKAEAVVNGLLLRLRQEIR